MFMSCHQQPSCLTLRHVLSLPLCPDINKPIARQRGLDHGEPLLPILSQSHATAPRSESSHAQSASMPKSVGHMHQCFSRRLWLACPGRTVSMSAATPPRSWPAHETKQLALSRYKAIDNMRPHYHARPSRARQDKNYVMSVEQFLSEQTSTMMPDTFLPCARAFDTTRCTSYCDSGCSVANPYTPEKLKHLKWRSFRM